MQKLLTVAIDLDETLAGTFERIFEFGKNKFEWNIPFEEAVVQHDWWKIPGLGLTETMAYQLFDEYFLEDPENSLIPLVSGARDGVMRLREMGHATHIITARTESLRKNATKAWLARYLPEFDFNNQVHFTNHYEASGARSKGEVCQSIGAKILIDDNLEFLHSAASLGIHGILLDKPWNQNGNLHKNITRVAHWNEVPALIQEYSKRLS